MEIWKILVSLKLKLKYVYLAFTKYHIFSYIYNYSYYFTKRLSLARNVISLCQAPNNYLQVIHKRDRVILITEYTKYIFFNYQAIKQTKSEHHTGEQKKLQQL